jgi:hypothetical protein
MRSSRLVLSSLALATLSLGVFPGCASIKKQKECVAFVEKVNTSVSDIEKHSKGANGGDAKAASDSMKKVAELYDKLGTDIGALGIETPDLKAKATEYQGMCTKAAKAARDVAEALDKTDAAKAETAQKDLEAVSKQEDTLVSSVNTFCQGK